MCLARSRVHSQTTQDFGISIYFESFGVIKIIGHKNILDVTNSPRYKEQLHDEGPDLQKIE